MTVQKASRHLTQYVEKYPVPDTATNVCKDIVVLVKELLFSSTSGTLQKRKERELEALVAQAFGVDSSPAKTAD